MPGISFGARTTRENNYVGVTKESVATQRMEHLGPGSHLHDGVTSSFTRTRPSFAAFGATAERRFVGDAARKFDDAPGPGMYLNDAAPRNSPSRQRDGAGGVFRSGTSRSFGAAEAGATSPRRKPAHH